MNSIQRIAKSVGTRRMSSIVNPNSKMTPELAKIRARQDFFQIADGKMVHEKTSFDRVLFLFTSAGVVVAMGMTFKFYYDFSFPKKA